MGENGKFELFKRRIEGCCNGLCKEVGWAASTSKVVKYTSLACLTVQNVVLTISMRYSRTRQKEQYMATTAVVMVELLKLLCCLLVIFLQEKSSTTRFFNSIYNNIVLQPVDCLKIMVPGFVYMVQNNLLYLAITHLETATFQVTYQLKILTTAVFSVAMLGRKLSRTQWLSLVILFMGVSMIVHLQANQKPTSATDTQTQKNPQNMVIGFTAVFISCVLSGFAGVYFEKLLKSSSQTLYIRNVQLATFGLITGLLAVAVFDLPIVMQHGFFYGYDGLVVFIIIMQSFGGLMVAVVVKYADNILKGFATSFAILLSFVISILFFNFQPSPLFILATSLVIISVYLYNSGVSMPVVHKTPQH